MILGIGTDVVQIDRIKKSCQKEGFLKRIYTANELKRADELAEERKWQFLANRYAGKEAFAKAVGTGMGEHLSWQDIEILNNEKGAPVCSVSDSAKAFLCQFFKTDKISIHVSLSDDLVAVATVILEK